MTGALFIGFPELVYYKQYCRIAQTQEGEYRMERSDHKGSSRRERGAKHYSNGDPFAFGRAQTPSWLQLIRNTLLRILRNGSALGGHCARRGMIQLESVLLRLALKKQYATLGELVFRLHVAEEREVVLEDDEVLALFEEIRNTHSEIASVQQRLAELEERSAADFYAGA